ncbi:MAG: hypothetical protein J2P22_04050 [Nocardioides sp.]|nr:hypothetical protein [Nocardioides sp.]
MIPNTNPEIGASFKETDDHPRFTRPVIAWDDDGTPLVNGRRRLVRADNFDGYAGLVGGEFYDEERYIGLIPGGGWTVTYSIKDGPDTTPLVAWGLTESGELVPLDVDCNGYAENVRNVSNFARLTPPEYSRALPAGGVSPANPVDPEVRHAGSRDATDDHIGEYL